MLLTVHVKPKWVNITIFIYLLLLMIFTISTNKKPAVGVNQNCGSHIYQAQQGLQAKRQSRADQSFKLWLNTPGSP